MQIDITIEKIFTHVKSNKDGTITVTNNNPCRNGKPLVRHYLSLANVIETYGGRNSILGQTLYRYGNGNYPYFQH